MVPAWRLQIRRVSFPSGVVKSICANNYGRAGGYSPGSRTAATCDLGASEQSWISQVRLRWWGRARTAMLPSNPRAVPFRLSQKRAGSCCTTPSSAQRSLQGSVCSRHAVPRRWRTTLQTTRAVLLAPPPPHVTSRHVTSRHVTSHLAVQVAYDAANDELYILDTAAVACRLYKYRVAADEMLAAGVVLTSFTCSSVAVSATGSECFSGACCRWRQDAVAARCRGRLRRRPRHISRGGERTAAGPGCVVVCERVRRRCVRDPVGRARAHPLAQRAQHVHSCGGRALQPRHGQRARAHRPGALAACERVACSLGNPSTHCQFSSAQGPGLGLPRLHISSSQPH